MRDRFHRAPSAGDASSTTRTLPITEDQVKQLRKYRFAYRERVSSGISGEHRSTRRGTSPEFADYRAYVHGDDFRRIDWNAYARLNHLFIKESEVTTERDVIVLIDAGPTMNWRSGEAAQSKLEIASRLAAALGYVALWHFDRLSIQRFGMEQNREFGPAQGRSNILPMFQFCSQIAPVTSVSRDDVFRAIRSHKRPGKLVVISDFLWADFDRFRRTLADAAARQWQTNLILLEDTAEIDPSHLFEAGTNLELDALDARERMQVSNSARSLATYAANRNTWLETFRELDRLPKVTTLRMQAEPAATTTTLQQLFELGVLER